jgi:hypothetical protein
MAYHKKALHLVTILFHFKSKGRSIPTQGTPGNYVRRSERVMEKGHAMDIRVCNRYISVKQINE